MRTKNIVLIFIVLLMATGVAVYYVPREELSQTTTHTISSANTQHTFAATGQPRRDGGQATLPMQQITIITKSGRVQIAVEVASTREQQVDGLSNRASLASGSGMLFVFNPPTTDGFWMKDMRFSLDIIWASSDGTITTLYKHLAPDTYPQSFYPASPATYVLEVPAGYADANNIAIGDKIVVQ